MSPKPLPFVVPKTHIKPKIVQRREAKRMTIVAGFSGAGGVILCADTQETVQGYAKREVEKIKTYRGRKDYEYNLAIGGAGESGPYIDALITELVTAINKIHEYDLAAIDGAMKDCLPEFYAKHIWPRTNPPSLETIVLVQRTEGGHAEMFHTSDTAVNYVSDNPICIGIGAYLAEYILKRSLAAGASMTHMLAVAAYMLHEVRENVDGCGKNATIWWFDREGNSDLFWDPTERNLFLEKQAPEINVALAHVMQYITTMETDPYGQFCTDPDKLMELLSGLRKQQIEAYEDELASEKKIREFRDGLEKRKKQGTTDDDIPF